MTKKKPDLKTGNPQGGKTQNKAVKAGTRKAALKPAAEDQEIGGPKGLEPTRYGDWEQKGRCTDF